MYKSHLSHNEEYIFENVILVVINMNNNTSKVNIPSAIIHQQLFLVLVFSDI